MSAANMLIACGLWLYLPTVGQPSLSKLRELLVPHRLQ